MFFLKKDLNPGTFWGHLEKLKIMWTTYLKKWEVSRIVDEFIQCSCYASFLLCLREML